MSGSLIDICLKLESWGLGFGFGEEGGLNR